MPAANTKAPPNATWNAAEIGGVSMYFQRTQLIVPSSSTTTQMANVVAVQKFGHVFVSYVGFVKCDPGRYLFGQTIGQVVNAGNLEALSK